MSDKEIVDVENREITIVPEQKTPEDLLLTARDAAQALERVIQLNEKPPMMFNGKRYLEIHHWQTLGSFYHCSVRTHEAEPCEIDGVNGFVAKCDLLNDKTGAIVGGSVAYCMRDEPNWKTKPMYALASMAQTRAGSKALSNRFRFVAVVAGYEGCPLEEVTDEMRNQKQVSMPKSRAVSKAVSAPEHLPAEPDAGNPPGVRAPISVIGGPRPLTEAEEAAIKIPTSKFFARLHQVAREKNVSPENMKIAIKDLYKKDSSKDLTDTEAALLIRAIENGSLG